MKLGTYKHSKSGNLYNLLMIGKSSEDPTKTLIVYQALYGENDIWIRPSEMWDELVEIKGKMVPRFFKVD